MIAVSMCPGVGRCYRMSLLQMSFMCKAVIVESCQEVGRYEIAETATWLSTYRKTTRMALVQ